MILSPFDPPTLALIGAVLQPHAPEPPMADRPDARLAVLLHRADRAGPFTATRDGYVNDAAGHVVGLTVPSCIEPELRAALAEFFARALNALPAVIVALGPDVEAAE